MTDRRAIRCHFQTAVHGLGRTILVTLMSSAISVASTGIGSAQIGTVSVSDTSSEVEENDGTSLPEWFGPSVTTSVKSQQLIQSIEESLDGEDVDYGRNIDAPNPNDLGVEETSFPSYSTLNPCFIPETERSFGIFSTGPQFLPGDISPKLGKSKEELDEYYIELAKYYISYSMDEEAHLALSQIEVASPQVEALKDIIQVISTEVDQSETGLSEFSGCASPMALWSFLGMPRNSLAPIFDPDVIIATFEKQSRFLRRRIAQRLVQRFIRLGDRESALILRDQMRFEVDETDILPLLLDLQMGESIAQNSMPALTSRLEISPRAEAISLIMFLLSEHTETSILSENLYSTAFSLALVGRSSKVSRDLVAQTISARLNAGQLHEAMVQLKQAVTLQLVDGEALVDIIQKTLDPSFETAGCVYILSDWMWNLVSQYQAELRLLSATRLLECGLTQNAVELFTAQKSREEIQLFETQVASLEYDAEQLGVLVESHRATLPDTELVKAARRAEMYEVSTSIFRKMGEDQNYLDDLWRAGDLEEYVIARPQEESWLDSIFYAPKTSGNDTVTTSLVQSALRDSEDLRSSVETMLRSFTDR